MVKGLDNRGIQLAGKWTALTYPGLKVTGLTNHISVSDSQPQLLGCEQACHGHHLVVRAWGQPDAGGLRLQNVKLRNVNAVQPGVAGLTVLQLDEREGSGVVWVMVVPDFHQGAMVDNLLEDICSGLAFLYPKVVPCVQGDVKIPAQDQAFGMMQDDC
ncbi:unnamed protein product [Caretta caretta]